MNEKHAEETRSFRDPMASRLEAAKLRREALEAPDTLEQYPCVDDLYDGFYLMIEGLGEDASQYFLGAEGIVCSILVFREETGCLHSEDGRSLVQLPDAVVARLAAHSATGWRIMIFVSAILLHLETKRAALDLAFICWAPLEDAYDAALATFARNIAHRLSSGDRAGVELSQEQFVHVLRSDGNWYLTPETKREPLDAGVVVYKGRRNGIERLTGYALKHRVGCNALAIVFWTALALGIIALIWHYLSAA